MPHGRKPKPSPWGPMLRKWEEKYGALYRDAIVDVAALSWEEAAALQAEIALVGEANCSWYLYDAAKRLLRTALPTSLVTSDEDMAQLRHNALKVLEERRAASEPASHSPSDQEVEDVYQAVLGRIAGEVVG